MPTGKLASTHIVKQSHVRLIGIVINEQFCIRVARRLGIEVPETFIVDLGQGKDDEVLFATKRYDRKMSQDKYKDSLLQACRLHQEDFCQALGIPAAEKSEHNNMHYMRQMFGLIRNVSSNPIEDQMKLWDLIVVNYMLGNTDCHLKNYSLIYSDDMKSRRLSPAYDIVCTVACETTREMSFYIGGKLDIRDISRESFSLAAKEIGIGEKNAMKRFDDIEAKFETVIKEVAESMINEGYEEAGRIRDVLLKLRVR